MAGCGVGVHRQVVRVLVLMVIPRTNPLVIATPSPALVRGDIRGPQTVFWVPSLKPAWCRVVSTSSAEASIGQVQYV